MPHAQLALPLFIIAAIVLFALGYTLSRRKRAAPSLVTAGQSALMTTLAEAAAEASAVAKRKRMVIARIAQAHDQVSWFAQSIASVIPVYHKREEDGAFEKLPGPLPRAGDDPESVSRVGTRARSLYIRKQDFKSYVHWARSVQ